jgi:hypothetical protein
VDVDGDGVIEIDGYGSHESLHIKRAVTVILNHTVPE